MYLIIAVSILSSVSLLVTVISVFLAFCSLEFYHVACTRSQHYGMLEVLYRDSV